MRTVVAVLFLAIASLATAQPTLKVGIIAPFAGSCAFMGEDLHDGATLAIEDNQPTQIDYQLLLEDDQMIPRLTTLAANKLIHTDQANCVWSLWAGGANIVAPIAEKAQVVHFNTGWDHKCTEDNHWSIVHGATFQDNARQNIEYFQKHGVKRIALAPQRTDGWVVLMDYARPLLKEAGIEIVFDEYTNVGQRDFRVYLMKLQQSNPDMIWAPITSPELDIFFKQFSELQIDIPITGYFTTFQPDSLKYAQGIKYFSDTWVQKSFEENFTNRFGHAPIIRAGHAYDLMNLYIQTAETLFEELGRAPTNQEMIIALKKPQELPELVVGAGQMSPSGSIITPYQLVKIEGDKVIEVD